MSPSKKAEGWRSIRRFFAIQSIMKKIYTINRRKVAVLFLAGAYLILLWLSASRDSLFLFVFLSLITALSLDTSDKSAFKKRLAIVLSFIVVYPLYYYLMFSDPGIINEYFVLNTAGLFVGSFLLYLPLLLIYGFLMSDFYLWIDKKLARVLITSVVALIFFTVFFLVESVNCMWVSTAEKGVGADEIQACRILNMYRPNSHRDSKIGIFIAIFMLANAGAIMLYGYLSALYLARSFIKKK